MHGVTLGNSASDEAEAALSAAAAAAAPDNVTQLYPPVVVVPVVAVWYARPRVLYGAVFVWIAVTGGRFLAPFLEHECGLTGAQIGAALAVQQLVGLPGNSCAGSAADRLEGRYPGYGRAGTVATGIVLGTIVFVLHGVSRMMMIPPTPISSEATPFFGDFSWFLILRILYALAVSLVFPVLDGMCLQHLGSEKQQEYGKERLWGAITWAIANVLLAPALDHYGFVVTYPVAILSGIAVLMTLYMYTTAINNNNSFYHRASSGGGILYRNIQKRNSDLELTSTAANFEEQNDDDERIYNEKSNREENADDGNDQGVSISQNKHQVIAAYSGSGSSFPTKELLRRLLFGSSPWYFGCSFLLAVVLLASGQVIVDSLIFLFFEDLGSSYTTMGWTVVLTVVFEIPVFSVADQLLERYGSTKLLLTAMACYIVRVLGYTFIPTGHVMYALILEPMHGVTYACSQTAVVDFVAKCMPRGYEATGQGLVYLVRGLGSVFGLLLGGWAGEAMGPRLLYRSAAAVVLTGSLILGFASLRRTAQSVPESDEVDVEITESTSSSLNGTAPCREIL